MIHAPAPGYRGDGGGLDPLFSGQAQARLNEQCRKAQVTQAAVDARAAELEARERAAARCVRQMTGQDTPKGWDQYPGVLAGDIEGRKKAQEAAAVPPAPEPPAPTLENSVTGNCPAPGATLNHDAQGSLLVEHDRALSSAFAGLLYDFAAYLTTQPMVPVGGAASPQPVIDRLVEFAKQRCLDLSDANVAHWREAAAVLALPQVQAGPGTLQREAASHAPACVRDAPASPLTTVAGLPDGRGRR